MNNNVSNIPLLSIACITYNQSKYIKETINGFLIQKTNFQFEILIHDDASTDNTEEIIQEYVEKYPKIIIPIFQTENQYRKGKGILAPFVFPVCKGKYIAICEGDDYWTDPSKLQKQVDFLEQNPEYGLAYTDFNIINLDGLLNKESEVLKFKNKLEKRFKSGNVFFDLLEGNFIPTLTVCFKKEVLDPLLPLMKNKQYMVDYWIWYHISVSYKVKFLPIITAMYRKHLEGATSIQNITNHLKKSGPVYYDILTYFYRKGRFYDKNGRDRQIVFRSCLTSFRSKELKITKRLNLLILAIYFFSLKGLISLFKKKLFSRL